MCSEAHLERAVATARKAFTSWRNAGDATHAAACGAAWAGCTGTQSLAVKVLEEQPQEPRRDAPCAELRGRLNHPVDLAPADRALASWPRIWTFERDRNSWAQLQR